MIVKKGLLQNEANTLKSISLRGVSQTDPGSCSHSPQCD